jgi:hypothetical protein
MCWVNEWAEVRPGRDERCRVVHGACEIMVPTKMVAYAVEKDAEFLERTLRWHHSHWEPSRSKRTQLGKIVAFLRCRPVLSAHQARPPCSWLSLGGHLLCQTAPERDRGHTWSWRLSPPPREALLPLPLLVFLSRGGFRLAAWRG